jgi:Holliday junction resolvase RusA-like endonuclease
MAQQRMTEGDLNKMGLVWDVPSGTYKKIAKQESKKKEPLIAKEIPGREVLMRTFQGIRSKSLEAHLKKLEFPVDPMGKPRMTQRDKWKKRPAVESYFRFKDQLNHIANGLKFDRKADALYVIFDIPMPDSWPKKDKEEMFGLPHQQKPDIDNLVKAVMDCLFESDQHIYLLTAEKRWAYKGCITFYERI